MKKWLIVGRAAALAGCAAIGLGVMLFTSAHSQGTAQKGAAMASHAVGPFEVKLTPQQPDNKEAEAAGFGRMLIDKQYHGGLEGTGKGEMMAAGDARGSGVYVALERVTATLKGRSGSFVLHHTGIMTRGTPQLTIGVVPDSGTGELAGLAGKMTISIAADGKHSYDFEYTLPDAQ